MRARTLVILALLLGTLATGVVAGEWRSSPIRAQQPADPPGPLPTVIPPILPPRPPLPPILPPVTAVRLDRMAVNVEIADLLASTSVDLTFKNPNDRPQEATLLFPLPPGVAVSDFTMTVDGQTLEGEILGRDDAARIYQGIVQRQRDPALLEYVGLNVVRARVFPVPPRGESKLTLRFTNLIQPENNVLRYRLPLSVGTDVGPTLAALTISARVRNARGVGSLFSPTQAMRFDRQSPTAMTASYEGVNVALRGAFELNVLPAGDAVAAGLVSYRTPGQDGFFMLWLTPPLRQEAVVSKDVVLVLDVSGSMQGRKIEQAKAGARFVLERLNEGDRFNVVPFSSSVDRFAPNLRPVSEAGSARDFVNRLRAEGSTNINDALLTALDQVRPVPSVGAVDRPATIIFLTDGLPTVGEQNRARILENVRTAAPSNVRLFVFGVGDDVDTTLLDTLATQNRGDVQYVLPAEDVEEKVSTLYSRISAPQLTDVRLDMSGATMTEVYPAPLPDLFGGQTLFVFGRYRGTGGAVNVRLSGSTREGPRTYTFSDMRLSDDDRSASYLPYLWASRKVTTLLREIRLRGPERSRELIDEVVSLSTRYGIITPYTSFLVQEPNAVSPQAAANAVARAAAAPASGTAATNAAAQTGQAGAAPPAPLPTSIPATPRPPLPAPGTPGQPAPTGIPAPPSTPTLEQRFVGDRSFVLRAGVWTDLAYVPGTETVKITFGSDEYFALLVQRPDLAAVFALGERVIVVVDGVAYEVVT